MITSLMLGLARHCRCPRNILVVVFFRRYGLLAPPPVQRLAEYLIFHLAYGSFVHVAVFTA